MNHERFHELIALEIYAQLDRDEEHELRAHLSGCAACRRWREEAGADLGLLARRAAESRALDHELHLAPERLESLRASSSAPRGTHWARHGWIAGLAAGMLLMAFAQQVLDPDARLEREGERAGHQSFGRDSVPPPATASGLLASLDAR